jgi:hypothetical protein
VLEPAMAKKKKIYFFRKYLLKKEKKKKKKNLNSLPVSSALDLACLGDLP